MSDASSPLLTARSDSTTCLIDPSSAIDPVAVSRLLEDVLFSSDAPATPLEDVVKQAVEALRQGMRDFWTAHHFHLLRDLTTSIIECHITDFEEAGQSYKNVCITCIKHPKRFDLIAGCGLIDLCCEVIMSPSTCASSTEQAVEALSQLAEVARPDAATLARITTTYVHYTAWRSGSQLIHFEQWSSMLRAVQEEEVAVAAVHEAACALMMNSAWRVRLTTLGTLGLLIQERRVAMAQGVPSTVYWKNVAAAYAPLAAKALGDENQQVRTEAVRNWNWMLLHCKTALTPECYAAGITGLLQLVRRVPALRRNLRSLAADAPKGVMDGIYKGAVRRLREIQALGSCLESHCAVFDVVFIAAHLAGDSCKASFVEEFDKFLKRISPLKSNEEVSECMACMENKANVVSKPGCTKSQCGACACTKAHFCSSCLARVFLASANPFKMACPNCRRDVCIDDIREIERSD